MGRADYLKLGDYNAICYECGKKFKASELKRHWQGYWVCEKHWEARHPQDFVKGTKDVQTPPWVQPLPAPIQITTETLMLESWNDPTDPYSGTILTEDLYPLETES